MAAGMKEEQLRKMGNV